MQDRDGSGSDAPPPLEDLYDEVTLRALERTAADPRRAPDPEVPRRRHRGGLAAVALNAATLGLRDALEGHDEREAVVEPDPGAGDTTRRWVTYLHVPGAPTASRIVVRPWLAPVVR